LGLEASEEHPEYSISEGDALVIKRFQICRAMGWDYQQYRTAPASFIAQIYALLRTEGEANKSEAAKANPNG